MTENEQLSAPVKLGLLGCLYFSQGLPFGFFTQALPVLMRKQGFSLGAIGLSSLVALPWALKFLWAPAVDRYSMARLGRRKSWIVPLQLCALVVLSVVALAPLSMPVLLGAFLLLNLVAATQDIATDGLAVDLLEPHERGLGNGLQVAAYRVGMIVGGGARLFCALLPGSGAGARRARRREQAVSVPGGRAGLARRRADDRGLTYLFGTRTGADRNDSYTFSMLPFDRIRGMRPLLGALAAGSLLGFSACGGAVAEGSEYDPYWGMDVESDGGTAGDAGRTGSTGGNGGQGGRGGTGGRPGQGGVAGSVAAGGTAGTASGGAAGSISFAGSAGTGFGGEAGSISFAGSIGMAGAAGSAAMPENWCVNVDGGLGSVPSSAFDVEQDVARRFCGSDFDPNFNHQIICLPNPGVAQTCESFYPEDLIGLLYRCGLQSGASYVCGPRRPPARLDNTANCDGNECCYVLAGGCPID